MSCLFPLRTMLDGDPFEAIMSETPAIRVSYASDDAKTARRRNAKGEGRLPPFAFRVSD